MEYRLFTVTSLATPSAAVVVVPESTASEPIITTRELSLISHGSTSRRLYVGQSGLIDADAVAATIGCGTRLGGCDVSIRAAPMTS